MAPNDAPSLEHHGPPRLRARFGDLDLPWVPLGTFPTPVERLEGLSAELESEVWIKRDDLSGELYGGNKVRKLELLLADALARGRDRVMTFGAYGSHHGLATAIYARHVGLEAHLHLHPQPITQHVLDDLILDAAVGAHLTRVPYQALAPLSIALLMATSKPGEVIPVGGSSALGAVGFVEAGLELADQIAAGELPEPELIFVAAGTCGTAAGLALGLELAGLHSQVVAVRVVPAPVTTTWAIRRLHDTCLRLLRGAGLKGPRPRGIEVVLDPDELGPGYGVETPASKAAMDRFAQDGVELETTYTGKTAAALLRWARGDAKGKRILFWNTYSSVDLSKRLAAADPAAVPPAFHDALREGGRL